MTRDGPKMVHFRPKLAKHGRLVNVQWSKRVQKGPKGTKTVNPSVFDHFGPFQTKFNFLPQIDKVGFWRRYFGAKNQSLFEMVWRSQDGPKRLPNGQKHLGWPSRTLLDHLGTLTSLPCLAIFGRLRLINHERLSSMLYVGWTDGWMGLVCDGYHWS